MSALARNLTLLATRGANPRGLQLKAVSTRPEYRAAQRLSSKSGLVLLGPNLPDMGQVPE